MVLFVIKGLEKDSPNFFTDSSKYADRIHLLQMSNLPAEVSFKVRFKKLWGMLTLKLC
jgi:hypothetical protein